MNENYNVLSETDFIQSTYEFVEYYVGMAKMVVFWHVKAMRFTVKAYCGPETGVLDKYSYLIVKNGIKIVITSAAQPGSFQILSFVNLHGDAVKRIGIRVDNVAVFYRTAVENGAIPLQEPERLQDSEGFVDRASIKIFDDNEICLINNDNYHGEFLPGYRKVEEEYKTNIEDTELLKIDHIASALRPNEIYLWESYFNKIFKSKTLKEFDERYKSNEKKIGILLKVLGYDNSDVSNVLVEPSLKSKSQVQQFIDENYGTGIQHIAFISKNILNTVRVLKNNGVKFISSPKSYYDKLAEKYPHLNITQFKEHNILCDIVDDGLLLQIFTAPIGDRSTFFYEIIQRVNNYRGFGMNNIQALFEAMESDLTDQSVL